MDSSSNALSAPGREPLRLLTVHAHPDDEASKGSATMAKYVAEGDEVMVVTCTGGERGDILNPAVNAVPQAHWDLPGLRRVEMARSQAALGIQHVWLGFMDSGLPEDPEKEPLPFGSFGTLPLSIASRPLVRLIRRFKPHVVVSYDENGGYPHPDHIMAHRVAVEAFRAAADPSLYPEAGEAWAPAKLYYDRAFNPERFRAIHQAFEDEGVPSPYAEWIAKRFDENTEGQDPAVPVHETTTQVNIGDYIGAREDALRAHASQVDPNGFFFAVSPDMQRRAWPWDDYTLISSSVETQVPESDLFAGLRAGHTATP